MPAGKRCRVSKKVMDEEQPLSQSDNFWNQTQGGLVKGQLTACLEWGNTWPPLWATIHSRRRWWTDSCLCEGEMPERPCLWPPCRWAMALSWVLKTRLWVSWWWVSLPCTLVAGLVLFFSESQARRIYSILMLIKLRLGEVKLPPSNPRQVAQWSQEDYNSQFFCSGLSFTPSGRVSR